MQEIFNIHIFFIRIESHTLVFFITKITSKNGKATMAWTILNTNICVGYVHSKFLSHFREILP